MSTEGLPLEKNAVVSPFPRVIRRDLPNSKSTKPRVVSWLGHKIEKAVDAACAAAGHEPVGKQIQAEIEFKMRHLPEQARLFFNTHTFQLRYPPSPTF